MRFAVIGSRTYPVTAELFESLSPAQKTEARKLGKAYVSKHLPKYLRPGDSVISGAAKGPDTWGVETARTMGLECEEYPADWSKGRGAGFDRNTTIAARSEALVAFWDGVSRGTLDTINKAHAAGKPVLVIKGDPRYVKASPEWTKLELARGGRFSQVEGQDDTRREPELV